MGNIRRREESYLLRRAMDFKVEGKRKSGRPKKTWIKWISEDMKPEKVNEATVYNRAEWKKAKAKLDGQNLRFSNRRNGMNNVKQER